MFASNGGSFIQNSKDLRTYCEAGNRNIGVLGLVIQYSMGKDTFSGRQSTRVIISYSNTGGAHRSHENTPHSWISCQGFILLFCFIHKGRCFHLFQGALRGVGGC